MVVAVPSKVKKMTAGVRLWMRFNKSDETEVLECDKSAILKRVAILSRVLRILGPVLSHSSNILAREKAMQRCQSHFLWGSRLGTKRLQMKAAGKPVKSTSPNDGEVSLHEHSTNGVHVEITKFKSEIGRIVHVAI